MWKMFSVGNRKSIHLEVLYQSIHLEVFFQSMHLEVLLLSIHRQSVIITKVCDYAKDKFNMNCPCYRYSNSLANMLSPQCDLAYSNGHFLCLRTYMSTAFLLASILPFDIVGIVNWHLNNKLQWNPKQNWYICITENAYEHVICGDSQFVSSSMYSIHDIYRNIRSITCHKAVLWSFWMFENWNRSFVLWLIYIYGYLNILKGCITFMRCTCSTIVNVFYHCWRNKSYLMTMV